MSNAAKSNDMDRSKVTVIFCMGSSCFSRGGNHNLSSLQSYIKENKLQSRVHLEGRLCQDKCRNGPHITINDRTYQAVDSGVVLDLVKYHLENKG